MTESIIMSVFLTITLGLIGGLALMWLTAIVLPVGLGYWASATAVVLGRILHTAITESSRD